MSALIGLAERGWVPDVLVRAGIRVLLQRRLSAESTGGVERQGEVLHQLLEESRYGPIAKVPDTANEQHYEVPAEFFHTVLGPNLKYSACLWSSGARDLESAERAMLALTCERAELRDGQRILELGCGWGSLTLWMAASYPSAQITAVSNSASQRAWIEQRCEEAGLRNVEVKTVDINVFETDEQ